MKRIYCFLVLGFFFCLNACAPAKFGIVPMPEDKKPLVSSRTIQMGQSFSSSAALNATEYTFNYPLAAMRFDLPQNQIVMVGTNEKNRLNEKPVFLFKSSTGEIPWSIKTLTPNFKIVTSHVLPERIILAGRGNTIFAVDSKNGHDVWQRPGNNITVGFSKNLAFSKHNVNGVSQLEVFDALSGKDLWTRDQFNCKWWGYKTFLPDDKTMLLYGDGLHLFDLETGVGWDYDVDTNAVGGIGKVIAGEALTVVAALAGTVHVNTVRTDRLENLTSNALIIKDKVYYAGNSILVCVDLKTGKELWNVKLPKKAGHTGLFEEDDHVLLIGFGWCHKNRVTADYTQPFIARFDKKDGRQLLYQEVALKSYIRGYAIKPEGYFLVSKGQVIFVDKKNPANATTPGPVDKEKGDLYADALTLISNPQNYFVPDENNTEKRLINLTVFKTDKSDIWVRTANGIIHYNNHLEVQNWFPNNRLHYKFHELDSILLTRGFKQKCTNEKKDQCKQNEYIKIIDRADNGKLLGEIKTEFAGRIDDGSLILWDSTKFTNTITVLPLDNLKLFLSKE